LKHPSELSAWFRRSSCLCRKALWLWSITFPDHVAYVAARDAIKREQLAKAGARLANLLNAIWP